MAKEEGAARIRDTTVLNVLFCNCALLLFWCPFLVSLFGFRFWCPFPVSFFDFRVGVLFGFCLLVAVFEFPFLVSVFGVSVFVCFLVSI